MDEGYTKRSILLKAKFMQIGNGRRRTKDKLAKDVLGPEPLSQVRQQIFAPHFDSGAILVISTPVSDFQLTLYPVTIV